MLDIVSLCLRSLEQTCRDSSAGRWLRSFDRPAILQLRELWSGSGPDLKRLWHDPPLDPEIRAKVAEQAMRWVLLPALITIVLAAALVIATVGFSEPTRFVPLIVLGVPCIAVYRLKQAERWLAAAAVFCAAATCHVLSAVLLHGVRVPAYDLGVLILMLIVTLFGMRWATAAALAFIVAGALWMLLEANGLQSGTPQPGIALSFGLHVGIILLALALVGGPQLLLTNALREANVERQRAEQARMSEVASANAFHAVFNQSSVALALLTVDGRVIQSNLRAQGFLDRREASLVGCKLFNTARFSEPQRDLLQRALEQATLGHASQHELTLSHEGESGSVFQVVFSPLLAANGCVEHVLVEIVDVSDLVETRNLLAQARRLEALGKLSGGVAHDLNNMFAAILGGCELVRIARGDARKIEDHVQLIQASVQRAATLTKQLLAFGRKDLWNSEQLDVNQLLSEVSRLLERTLHKNVDLVLVPSDEPSYVRADSAALEHALLNLALNAQDAMRNGGTLTLACRPSMLDELACERLQHDIEPGPCVILSVEDTGTGISSEVQERMFEPFFTTKKPGEGTGLGLAAVHGTMRAHRGAIAVHSEPGIGTRIELLLPATGPIAPRAVVELSEVPVPTHLDALVLLADDEALARSAIAGMLQSAGCEVHAVGDGAALIDALAEGVDPDVIVTDLAMPGLGGVNLVQTLELLRPNCRLLLITGYTGDDVASVCPPRSGRRLLRKPFLRGELLGTLAELLAHEQRTARTVRLHRA